MADQSHPPRLEIVVDHRERRSGLIEAIGARWSPMGVGTLPVGDVGVGRRVLVERKTVHDFVVSLRDGRLFRQLYALCGECRRPLLVVEGTDTVAAAGVDTESLRGLLLSIAIGYRVPMLRTRDVDETATYVARIASQEQRRLGRGTQQEVTGPLTVLAAIPGVGEERARRLLAYHGSLSAVFIAGEKALRRVPGIGPETARRIQEIGGAHA